MKTQQRQHEILSKHSMRTQKIQISQNNSYKCISKHSTCSTRQIIHCWYTGKEVMPATKAQMFALRRSAVRIELSMSIAKMPLSFHACLRSILSSILNCNQRYIKFRLVDCVHIFM